MWEHVPTPLNPCWYPHQCSATDVPRHACMPRDDAWCAVE